MQSLITPQFLCGILLLFVTIASARKASYSACAKCHKNSKPTVVQIFPSIGIGAGPHWDHVSKKLYFVDTPGGKMYRLDPATGESTNAKIADGAVEIAVPVKDEPNKFLVTVGLNFVVVTWDPRKNSTNPKMEIIAHVENVNNTHLNGGKADTHGRLWTGTLGKSLDNGDILLSISAFYRLTGDGVVKTILKPVTISSGVAWNKEDKIFYYIDSTTEVIAAYDFDAEHGEIYNRRIAVDLFDEYNKTGHATSMTIDTCGCLYVTMYAGGRVIKIDPVGGKTLQSIEIPVSEVSSLTWGGDQFDILYVTTSTGDRTAEEIAADPAAGGVFAVYGLGAQGFKANEFSLRRHHY